MTVVEWLKARSLGQVALLFLVVGVILLIVRKLTGRRDETRP